MKKLLTLTAICLVIASGNVHSQKARLGITAGTAIGTYKIKAEGISVTSKGKPGITIGIMSDIPLGRSTSFMPALNFVQKGGTLKAEGVEEKLTTNYLEVPLNFVYHAKVNKGKLFFGAGPSLNIGISGTDKWNAEGTSGSDKIKFGKDQDFRRLDAGLNFVTGYYGKSGFLMTINYNSGLSNAIDNGGEGGKFLNRYIGIRVGFML